MTNPVRDGGYYAIKGFAFQFDKTILHLLSQKDERATVTIEQEQDLADVNFIFQVKYKESSKYSSSKIREAVIQLLTVFISERKIPILYAHFNDKSEEIICFSFSELNKLLGKNAGQFSDKDKKEFVNKFRIHFAANFAAQFDRLIDAIKVEFKCLEDEAIIFHAQICKFLEKRVTDNKSSKKQLRSATKLEVKNEVSQKRSQVFFASYADFLGNQRYFTLIKKRYFQERNVNDHERFFILELPEGISIEKIHEIVMRIKERFFIRTQQLIKSQPPYIYLRNCPKDLLPKLKMRLTKEKLSLLDGHCFDGSGFLLSNIIQLATIHYPVHIKFINHEQDLPQIIEAVTKPKRIFQFYTKTAIDIPVDYDQADICLTNILDLLQII